MGVTFDECLNFDVYISKCNQQSQPDGWNYQVEDINDIFLMVSLFTKCTRHW